jgi:hypothetical protein
MPECLFGAMSSAAHAPRQFAAVKDLLVVAGGARRCPASSGSTSMVTSWIMRE